MPVRSSLIAAALGLVLGGGVALGCGEPTTASRPPRAAGVTANDDGIEGNANPAGNAAPGSPMSGLASYYADALAGHRTASGEPYDPAELTAAHRTLPFGTLVEVTRADGRSVIVRINDRGPFGSKKRILDLSRRAAEKIGLVRAGVARVTARVVRKPKG